MLNYEKVRNWASPEIRHAYTARDVAIYALGIGMAQDPMDRAELPFVIQESSPPVMPSMAAVLGSPGSWMRDKPEFGVDYLRLVHGEQSVKLHAPLPSGGSVVATTRVTRVVDKGEGKGALLYTEKLIKDGADGKLLATCESVSFLRANGGFSKNGGGDPAIEPPRPTPEREPELVLEFQTRPETALIYRLSGDLNPLHSDPEVATRANFPRPILHGLATYGNACHGLVKGFCGYDVARLKSMYARFSSPTYPGDLIRLEFWKDGGEIAFRARVPARDVTVLSHGRAVVAGA